MDRSDRWLLLLILLTCIGAVLRVIGLNQQMWFDELLTVDLTLRIPMSELLVSYPTDNQHPLYSVLAKLSVDAFGESPWAVRLPSLLFGTMSIPVLYMVGAKITSRAEGLAAAAMLAFSYHHIWFSQNARGYTGLMLATLLATWFYLRGQEQTKRWPWVAYAFTVALGAYCHLTMIFVAVSHAMITVGGALLARIRRQPLTPFIAPSLAIIGSGLLTILMYAPLMDDLLAFFGQGREAVTYEWMSLRWAISETLRVLQIGYGGIALLGVACLSAVGCWQFYRRNPQFLCFIVLPGLVGLFVMLALGRNIWPRFFLYVFGLVLIVVVHGVWTVTGLIAKRIPAGDRWHLAQWMPVGVILLVLVQCVRMLSPLYTYPKQDITGAMDFVRATANSDEPIVTVGMASYVYRDFYKMPWTAIKEASELDRLLANGHRTWVVSMFPIHLKADSPKIAERIESDFELVRTFPATVGGGNVRVLCWQPGGESGNHSQ